MEAPEEGWSHASHHTAGVNTSSRGTRACAGTRGSSSHHLIFAGITAVLGKDFCNCPKPSLGSTRQALEEMVSVHLLPLPPCLPGAWLAGEEPGSLTQTRLMLLEQINVRQNAPQQSNQQPTPPQTAPSVGSRVTTALGQTKRSHGSWSWCFCRLQNLGSGRISTATGKQRGGGSYFAFFLCF